MATKRDHAAVEATPTNPSSPATKAKTSASSSSSTSKPPAFTPADKSEVKTLLRFFRELRSSGQVFNKEDSKHVGFKDRLIELGRKYMADPNAGVFKYRLFGSWDPVLQHYGILIESDDSVVIRPVHLRILFSIIAEYVVEHTLAKLENNSYKTECFVEAMNEALKKVFIMRPNNGVHDVFWLQHTEEKGWEMGWDEGYCITTNEDCVPMKMPMLPIRDMFEAKGHKLSMKWAAGYVNESCNSYKVMLMKLMN
jgi:hypothetical protein